MKKVRWMLVEGVDIPEDHYYVTLNNSDFTGLTVGLLGDKHRVILSFGSVEAATMIEEGNLLFEVLEIEDESRALLPLYNGHHCYTLYQLENGYLWQTIQQTAGEFLLYKNVKEYCILSENYVIYVLSRFAPDIRIENVD